MTGVRIVIGMTTTNAEWLAFYNDGKKFHKTAQGSVRRPSIFTPEIIQNIVAMGIEKYFMAIFMHRGVLPYNHTMTDLLESARPLLSLSAELEATMRRIDSLQRICSIEDFSITKPTASDVPAFLAAIDEVASLADAELAHASVVSMP
jgi:hypothetical protein